MLLYEQTAVKKIFTVAKALFYLNSCSKLKKHKINPNYGNATEIEFYLQESSEVPANPPTILPRI